MSSNGVWFGICAKYLALGTYPTSAVSALMNVKSNILNMRIILFILFYYLMLHFGIGHFDHDQRHCQVTSPAYAWNSKDNRVKDSKVVLI